MSDGSAPIGFNPRTKTFNPGFSLSGMATSGLYNVAKSLVSAAMRGGGTTLGPKYKTHYRKKFSKKFKKRYRNKGGRIRPEKKWFNSSKNSIDYFEVFACNGAIGPSTVGYYGNQLHWIFTPSGGVTNGQIVGQKAQVKRIQYKIHVTQGTVQDPTSTNFYAAFNTRVILGYLKTWDNTSLAFDIDAILAHPVQGNTCSFSTYGKEMFMYQKAPKSSTSYKVLLDHVFELDAGMKSDMIMGSIPCNIIAKFINNATNNASPASALKNCFFLLILPMQPLGVAQDKNVFAKFNTRFEYYDV